jgi:hypothetical protein
MYAVGLWDQQSQQRENALLGNGWARNSGRNSVFFAVWSEATMAGATVGTSVFSLRSVLWKCFLCGLFPGYIAWTSAGSELVPS